MAVEVIVPWREGCPHRERAWEWCRRLHQWPVVVSPGTPGGWVKALAVMPAIEASTAEIIVVADADVACDGVPAAVEAVQAGAAWAIPHGHVHRLTEAGTAAVLAGADWHGQPVEQKPYPGVAGGGFVVASRAVLLDTPMDPRFTSWGQEDESWAMALTATLGPPWRGDAPLIHLWHPPQQRLSRRRGSVDGWQLRRRYARARHDPAAMRRLLDEAQHALHPPEPAGHDHSPRRLR